MTVDFDQMMRDQAALQIAFGNKPWDMDDATRMVYIKDMVLAATDELHEALGEVDWKPWVPTNGIKRDAFVSELIDTLQFVMNLFAAADCDAAEIAMKLHRKHEINWQRVTDGTNGLNKCAVCRRALDDVHVACTADQCAYAEGISA